MESNDSGRTTASTEAPSSTPFVLGRNGEWWDAFLLWSLAGAAIVAAIVAAATAGSILAHKREAETANRELERYKKETDGRIADASAVAETAKAETITARAEVAKANLETEKIRAKIAWRRLTQEQFIALNAALAGQSFEVWTSFVGIDPEAVTYRGDINEALTRSGLKTKFFSGWERAVGLHLSGPPGPHLDALSFAFDLAKIPYMAVPPDPSFFPNEIVIVVGSKPPPD